MALIKCPKCGKELPEESQFCNWCETDLVLGETDVISYQPNETKTLSPTKKKAILQLLIRCGISFSALAIIILLVSLPITKRNKQFDEAKAYVLDGKYSRAADIFEDIIEHKRNEIYTFSIEHFEMLCHEGNYSDASDWRYQLYFLNLLSESEFEEMGNEIDYGNAQKMVEEGDYVDAYHQYVDLRDYKDSADQAKLIWDNHKDKFYELAVSNFDLNLEHSLLAAEEQFEELGDYEDSKDYLKKISFLLDICGTYKDSSDDTSIISVGQLINYSGYDRSIRHKLVLSEYKGELCLLADYKNSMGAIYVLREGEVYWHLVNVHDDGTFGLYSNRYSSGKFAKLDKLSDSTNPLREPAIGMTADEVRLSTWGEPDDINKTTSTWGVREQWVYPGQRYIYLEDGIVTAIQE